MTDKTEPPAPGDLLHAAVALLRRFGFFAASGSQFVYPAGSLQKVLEIVAAYDGAAATPAPAHAPVRDVGDIDVVESVTNSVLPGFVRQEVERAIHDAEHPVGMSVHDGKARIGADKLRYMLRLIDSMQAPAPAPDTGCRHQRYTVDRHEQAGRCMDCGAEGRMQFVVPSTPARADHASVEQWESALTAVMPSDFKDWHENSRREWPDIAAHVISNLRQREDDAWAVVERLQSPVAGEPVARVRTMTTGGNAGVAWRGVPVDGAPLLPDVERRLIAAWNALAPESNLQSTGSTS